MVAIYTLKRMRWALFAFGLALLLTACPGEPPPAAVGALQLTVSGLPEDAPATVSVSGPDEFNQEITASARLDELMAGNYQIEAASVQHADETYLPEPELQSVAVIAGETATASVSYAAEADEATTGSLALSIEGLPEDTPAEVTVTTPGGFSQTLSTSATLDGLEPGDYTLSAVAVTSIYTYEPEPAAQTVTVTAGGTASASVGYSAVTGALQLVIDGLPDGVDAGVAVTGPDGFDLSVSESTVLEDLEPGDYAYDAPEITTAEDLTDGEVGYRYGATERSPWGGGVTAGETARLELAYEAVSGSILVVVRGLPSGANAQIALGQDGVFVQDFTATGALNNLESGSYAYAAKGVPVDGYSYEPDLSEGELLLELGETFVLNVTYAPIDGKLTLLSEGLPSGANAKVIIENPGSSLVVVTTPRTLTLDPGVYGLEPQDSVAVGDSSYRLIKGPLQAEVTAGEASTATFSYGRVGNLHVVIKGLPEGVEAKVHVTGPDGYESGLITETTTLRRLRIEGLYTVKAEALFPQYYPEPASQTTGVLEDMTTEATVTYKPPVNAPYP